VRGKLDPNETCPATVPHCIGECHLANSIQDIGLSGNSVNLLATGVVGIIDFVSTIPAVMFMDRWGRKSVLMIGAVGMGISQLIVATIYCVYRNSWLEHKSAGWATCVFIWIYIANFAFSIGCVNWIMPSEMFSIAIRGKAVGLAIASNWLSTFIVALIIPRMIKNISFGTFYFFLAFCVILFFWVWFYVPETRGKQSTPTGQSRAEQASPRTHEMPMSQVAH
jgi:MFS family permease